MRKRAWIIAATCAVWTSVGLALAAGPPGQYGKEVPLGTSTKGLGRGPWTEGQPSKHGKPQAKGTITQELQPEYEPHGKREVHEPAYELQEKHEVHKHHRLQEQVVEENFRGTYFRPQHAEYFRRCYTEAGGLPPGLQKQLATTGHLPPGLEMQLHRNGHLPPGLEKKMVPVTTCVDTRIGPLPPDTRLYLMGHDAYLINQHTGAIVDVLRGVR